MQQARHDLFALIRLFLPAYLHFDLVGLDTLVQGAHVLLWQITSIIDASVVTQEVLHKPRCRNVRQPSQMRIKGLLHVPEASMIRV